MCICVCVSGSAQYSTAQYSIALHYTVLHGTALHYTALFLLLYLQHPDFPALLSPPCLGAALLAFTEMALPGLTEAFLGF